MGRQTKHHLHESHRMSTKQQKPLHPMQVNLDTLRLCAAIFDLDPLQMLVSWPFQSKKTMEETQARLLKLKGVMPNSILMQVLEFLSELMSNRGGAFQFTSDQMPNSLGDNAVTKWTSLLMEDVEWLKSEDLNHLFQ